MAVIALCHFDFSFSPVIIVFFKWTNTVSDAAVLFHYFKYLLMVLCFEDLFEYIFYLSFVCVNNMHVAVTGQIEDGQVFHSLEVFSSYFIHSAIITTVVPTLRQRMHACPRIRL